MKNYLFGISQYCLKLIESGFFERRMIDGMFDNSKEKWGSVQNGVIIEKPYYSPEINVIITVSQKFWLNIIKQLMELGYRKISVVYLQEDEYKEKTLDYRHFDYDKDKETLVLLYLEHKSYSGIWAVDYMCNHNYINQYNFKIKYFINDKEREEYYYDLIAARYIITEKLWIFDRNAVRAQIIQMWHGYPLKAMGNMLANYNGETDIFLENYWKRFNYILSYGLNYTTFLCACYGTLAKDYVVTGMPRNDLLFVTNGRQNMLDKFPNSKGKKIILYMPTFRELNDGIKNGDENGYLFYWSDFDIEELQRFCRKNNIFFLFKLHPSDESKVKEWCIESDCLGVLTDQKLGDKAMYEFLNGADALITDYSSVYFDFLLLNRMIIFTNRDEERYESNRGLILEPLEFWRPGPLVNSISALYEELGKVIEGRDDFVEERAKLMPFVHKYMDGNSTQRLFDFMRNEQ